VAAWIGYIVANGLMLDSVPFLLAVGIPVLAARVGGDYRPNGRLRRLVEANRTDPWRGFKYPEQPSG
jgi:hypothetical protein